MRKKKAKCWMSCSTMPDRKSTRLNSSHLVISYAVFCLKKKHVEARGCGEDGARPELGEAAPRGLRPAQRAQRRTGRAHTRQRERAALLSRRRVGHVAQR